MGSKCVTVALMPNLQESTQLASNEDGQSDVSNHTYYTNEGEKPHLRSHDLSNTLEEIAILHIIVSEAQQAIDSSPEPKPLPVASLFRAYDQVLPQHGIDPDDDKHLSAFVFRVGGEIGDGDLVDKFQAILERMGIGLEFSDTSELPNSSPASARSWRQPQPQVQEPREESHYDAEDEDDEVDMTGGSQAQAAQADDSGTDDDSETDGSETDELSPETLAAIEAAKNAHGPAGIQRINPFLPLNQGDHAFSSSKVAATQDTQSSQGHDAVGGPKIGSTSLSPRRPTSGYLRRPTLEARQPWGLPLPPATPRANQQPLISQVSNQSHAGDERHDSPEDQRPPATSALVQSSRQSILSIMDKWRQAASERKEKSKPRVKFAETVIQRPDSRNQDDATTQESHRSAGDGAPALDNATTSHVRNTLSTVFENPENFPIETSAAQGRGPQPSSGVRPPASRSPQHSPRHGRDMEPRPAMIDNEAQTLAPSPADSGPMRQPASPKKEEPIPTVKHRSHVEMLEEQPLEPAGEQGAAPHDGPQQLPKPSPSQIVDPALKAREERMLRRAARARELYLASKVFNHWADKTARRVEREAVARRHMIRFRCFRAWAQTPSSKNPEVDHLRVLTAAQKLRRAITHHEDLFREVAAVAVEARNRKMVERALYKWQCHVSKAIVQQQAANRAKQTSYKRWSACANDHATLRHIVASHRQHSLETQAILKWQRFAENGIIRTAAAQHIGVCHLSTTYLREWWDQAEVMRRADDCRRYILTKKASRLFDLWNLGARAQAFTWRNEYVTLNRWFDAWQQRSEEDSQGLLEAELHSKRVAHAKFVDALHRVETDVKMKEQMGSRARLYIGATRLVEVFHRTIAQRKARDKQAVKQYLMARYQQMSATRKKKNFFLVLDHWRDAAAESARISQDSQQIGMNWQKAKYLACIATWSDKAYEEQQRYQTAQAYNVEIHLRMWTNFTARCQQQTDTSHAIWIMGKQRECTRKWAISSLQQGGHAHTAAAHKRRHARDTMNRTLQYWRTNAAKGDSGSVESFPQPDLRRSNLGGSFRNSTRTTFRRSQFARSQYPQTPLPVSRTPVRWRGQSLATSGFMSAPAMPPVTEVDELRSPTSSTAVEAEAFNSPSRPSAASVLPSTTPRAPIPTYLKRHAQVHTPSPSQSLKPQFGHSRSVAGPGPLSSIKERPSQASRVEIVPTQNQSTFPTRTNPEPGSPWTYTGGSKSVNPSLGRFAPIPDDEVFAAGAKGQSVGVNFGRSARNANFGPKIFSTPAGRRLGQSQ